MEKRILIAFLLSVVVLYGSQVLMRPKSVPAPTFPGASSAAPPAATPPAPTQAAPAPKPAVATPAPPPSDESILADAPQDLQVDAGLYTVTISNHGGVLKSVKLKAYLDPEGKPTELIDAAGASKVGWPLALNTLDARLDETIASANFVIKRVGQQVVMDYASNGIRVHKAITFEPEKYELSVEASLDREGKPVPHSIVWQGGFGDQSIPPDPAKRQVVYTIGGAYKRMTLASVKEPQDLAVGSNVGIEDQYFVAMFLLPGNSTTVKLRKAEYTGADGKVVGTLVLAVPGMEQPARLYVGPKDRPAEVQFGGIIDYGFFGFIAKPLMLALMFVHSYVGNFGWSIILLTAFINFVLFPLRLKQQVSMQKMQKIQPQMKTLQDRYKKLKANDPKRVEVQAQMMNIYKEHGINPMSGCLPLLLQMPFLFAFYTMLRVSIELRGAPWIFWIRDLSIYDPHYIMPILMAVSMLITQKMTPATMDPAQARMMMIMPLMFTVLFLWAASGLMLYWLTSNVIGIGQQFFINKYWVPKIESKSKNRVAKIERVE